MAKKKGTNGYVADLNRAVVDQMGLASVKDIPIGTQILIKKTARDMLVMDSIADQLIKLDDYTSTRFGSMGQEKVEVSPLLPYYDKASARVTDDLYNLGLTARKQAVKAEDPNDSKPADRMAELIQQMK